MDSQIWGLGVLISSILLIVISIIKFKLHPFLALLLSSFYVGVLMKMKPLNMIASIEDGIGGTLGFLAASKVWNLAN
jgi:H+/gluconate symporter and related permeases